MPTTTEIIAIRHGETVWNRQGRLQGQEDPELSPLGLRQAAALAQRLSGESFSVIVSSDLRRASQTAQAIADRAGGPVVLDPDLRERHFGIFQGYTWDQIRHLYPAEHEAYWQGPDYAPPGGGESAGQRHARVLQCVDRLKSQYAGGRILLVTHGGPLESLFKHTAGLGCQSSRHFSLFNAALNIFTVTDGQWKLQRWGDVEHLKDLEAADE